MTSTQARGSLGLSWTAQEEWWMCVFTPLMMTAMNHIQWAQLQPHQSPCPKNSSLGLHRWNHVLISQPLLPVHHISLEDVTICMTLLLLLLSSLWSAYHLCIMLMRTFWLSSAWKIFGWTKPKAKMVSVVCHEIGTYLRLSSVYFGVGYHGFLLGLNLDLATLWIES